MEETTAPVVNQKRPPLITFLCVFSFVGAILSLPVIISTFSQQAGSWYPYFFAISSVIGLSCMIGFWKMQKWALYTYVALTIVNQLVLINTGAWSVMSLIIPNLVILIGIKYKNLMK